MGSCVMRRWRHPYGTILRRLSRTSITRGSDRGLRCSARSTVSRGGRRPGAGRKRGRFPKTPHRARPELLPGHPVHVTLRLQRYVDELRTRQLYHVIRKVLALYLEWPDFHVVHISIQNNHLHLIVEAKNREALTSGMQSFAITCARALNRARGARGKVFASRYHARQITSPRQARHTLAYVLNNWRRHHADIVGGRLINFPYDPYSSALSFTGWTKRFDVRMPAEWIPLPVSPPQTALLKWQFERFGRIDPYECPGPHW
jgi:REP element-mobilizing transposase RayT